METGRKGMKKGSEVNKEKYSLKEQKGKERIGKSMRAAGKVTGSNSICSFTLMKRAQVRDG